MNRAVVIGGIAVAILNAIPALVGLWCWYRGRANRAFWILLRVGQLGALAFAILVGVLAIAGDYSSDRLFYLYALLPLAIAFVAEQIRITSAQTILDQRDLPDARAIGDLPEPEQHAIAAAILVREMVIMALSALVVVFLALRAASTAHGF